jgi:hypothetical protein
LKTLESRELKLTLRNARKRRNSDTRFNGLVVRCVDKKVDIPLPKAYSKEKIPLRRSEIPTSETSQKWSHLIRIASVIHPYQPDIDVAILIRCDCPRALKPREVILGKGDDQYAIRTLLGRGIIVQWVNQAVMMRTQILQPATGSSEDKFPTQETQIMPSLWIPWAKKI